MGSPPSTDWFPFHKRSILTWFFCCKVLRSSVFCFLIIQRVESLLRPEGDKIGWFCYLKFWFLKILDCENSALLYSAFLPSNCPYFLDLVSEQITALSKRAYKSLKPSEFTIGNLDDWTRASYHLRTCRCAFWIGRCHCQRTIVWGLPSSRYGNGGGQNTEPKQSGTWCPVETFSRGSPLPSER